MAVRVHTLTQGCCSCLCGCFESLHYTAVKRVGLMQQTQWSWEERFVMTCREVRHLHCSFDHMYYCYFWYCVVLGPSKAWFSRRLYTLWRMTPRPGTICVILFQPVHVYGVFEMCVCVSIRPNTHTQIYKM
jgi:hypothetical protein